MTNNVKKMNKDGKKLQKNAKTYCKIHFFMIQCYYIFIKEKKL